MAEWTEHPPNCSHFCSSTKWFMMNWTLLWAVNGNKDSNDTIRINSWDSSSHRSLSHHSFGTFLPHCVLKCSCTAVCRWHDRAAAGRAAPEGLRTRLRNLTVHRHQHLRDNRLEGLQPHDCEHRERYDSTQQFWNNGSFWFCLKENLKGKSFFSHGFVE